MAKQIPEDGMLPDGVAEAVFGAPTSDYNDMAWWYPRIAAVLPQLPLPQTAIVRYQGPDDDLIALLDGHKPSHWAQLVRDVRAAAMGVAPGGKPFFLRTGHLSGKHDWSETCYVAAQDAGTVGRHISALVEHSVMADMYGLPTGTWVVRQLLPTNPLFRCQAYGGFPVVREYRVFVGEGELCAVPYWPPAACEEGNPDIPDWEQVLYNASKIDADDSMLLAQLANQALHAVTDDDPEAPRSWSMDFLQAANGSWWLTDMADAARSYRWDPATAWVGRQAYERDHTL